MGCVRPRSPLRRHLCACACALALLLGCSKRGPAPDEPGASAASDPDLDRVDPDLDRVCAHSYEVLIVPTGAASAGVRSDFMTNCRVGAEARRAALGEAAWDERVRCILAGDDPDELGRCDGREPVPEGEPASAIDLARVCDKLIEVINQEMGGSLFPAEQREDFARGCVEQLEQARAEDPAKFEREARCILDARGLQELEACES